MKTTYLNLKIKETLIFVILHLKPLQNFKTKISKQKGNTIM